MLQILVTQYTVPIKDEGDFVLVLKFSEVYFRGSKLKVSVVF